MILQMVKSLLPGLLLIGLVGSLSVWFKTTKGRRGEAAVHRAIETSGAVCITDFIVPDGRGGLTQVDHVIKLPIGIAVIETKNYSGRIYGKGGDATWMQAIGGQKNRFQNPLRQNHLHVEAIKAIAGQGVDVIGQVIFVGDATFKEMPEGVSGIHELKKHLRLVADMPIPAEVEAAWSKLKASMLIDDASRSKHLAQVRAKKSSKVLT